MTTTEGNTQKNRYDGEGLRAEMEENGRLVNFLFDGEKVIAETDGDPNVIRYIRGYDLISSDSEKAKTYYHYASDEMGSITHVIDEAGNVCNHYEYDAFGDFTVKEETIPNRFGFTGEQFDPVAGLYYLRARFYNPVIGRFIQEDTYYGDGLNLYTYCANNPVKYIDPSGNKKQCKLVTKMIEQLESVDPSIKDIADKLNNLSTKDKKAILKQIEKAGGNVDELQKIIDQCKKGRNAGEYHSFYKFELLKEDYMKSDSVQFRKANKAFLEKLNSDADFKKKILSAHPEIKQWLDNPNLSNSPTGFTWHHFEGEGILLLVDRTDHSSNFSIYHPTGKGGRDIWGGGKAGRQGKIK